MLLSVLLVLFSATLVATGNGNGRNSMSGGNESFVINESCKDCHNKINNLSNVTNVIVHHNNTEDLMNCSNCHIREKIFFYSTNCEDCHAEAYDNTKQFHHAVLHAGECNVCHVDHGAANNSNQGAGKGRQ